VAARFKPRTSPYAFQGLGFPGLDILLEAGRAYELPVVTEVLHPEDVERVAAGADMLQIGARNMQNFALLKEVGARPAAGAPQARHERDDRGAAAGRRVRHVRRQTIASPVRARHPHVRDDDAQYPRHQARCPC